MKYNIGILGNGFVGSAVTSGFGLHANIKIYDIEPKRATHTFSEVVNDSEFIFVSVPTPMKGVRGGEIDLSIVYSVFDQVAETNERTDNIFILKSTVVPGTIEKIIDRYPTLNIIHSPEFLTERAARLEFINAARIVLGGAPELTTRAKGLFKDRFPHVNVIETDVTTAQFIKYMANCFFATKVSFMNEMRQAGDKLNINWDDAMAGFITDGRIGNSHLDVPGHDGSYGFGGKCFPKDLNAFIHMFEKIGVDPLVMNAAWEKNLEVRENLDWTEIKGAVSEGEANG